MPPIEWPTPMATRLEPGSKFGTKVPETSPCVTNAMGVVIDRVVYRWGDEEDIVDRRGALRRPGGRTRRQ